MPGGWRCRFRGRAMDDDWSRRRSRWVGRSCRFRRETWWASPTRGEVPRVLLILGAGVGRLWTSRIYLAEI